MMERMKHWARAVKRDAVALYIASRDPRTPWLTKAVALAVAAYAMSPIDLIPDFIPVLGHLDDLVIVPLGILLVVRLIPGELISEFRASASGRASTPRAKLISSGLSVRRARLKSWRTWDLSRYHFRSFPTTCWSRSSNGGPQKLRASGSLPMV